MIYLDHASTTKLSPKVKQTIIDNLDLFGNPSNETPLGKEVKNKIEIAREKVAKAINAKPQNIIFTSGASEANNWVFNNFENVTTSNVEHSSIFNTTDNSKTKVDILFLENFNDCLKSADLLSLMYVNNELGEIYNIKSLVKSAKRQGVFCHSDCTQAIGNIKVDVEDLGVDFISFSGHKFHAPKGVGVLYARDTNILKPFIHGGKQEFGLRGGTENTLGIIAMGEAIEEAVENLKAKQEHCRKLKNETIRQLMVNGVDFIVNGEYTINSILNISIRDIDAQCLSNYLSMNDIYIATGSACESGMSHVIKNLADKNIIPKEYVYGTIRISYDLENTIEDIHKLVENINNFIKLTR